MIIQGDCLEEMRKMGANSIDFIVCDPPYGLNFMGKKWDSAVPNVDIWKEALRVCKPGSMLAAFGGSRTHHHLMIALEQAGWDIRDVIMWLYGSGFPKSHNVSKAIDKENGLERTKEVRVRCDGKLAGGVVTDGFINGVKDPSVTYSNVPLSNMSDKFNGYGTALKPAYEPIIIAMKPCDGTFAQNAEKWGVAGLNIDSNRIGSELIKTQAKKKGSSFTHIGDEQGFNGCEESHHQGRWPANIILHEEVRGQLGEPSRFFYCAKASAKERNEGCEDLEVSKCGVEALRDSGRGKEAKNNHPTVKPIALMKYIINLLAPPGNPILLDPFAGSGSTLIAAQELGIESIGIELNPEYVEIAQARLKKFDLKVN